MKTLKKVFYALAFLSLFVACSKSDDFVNNDVSGYNVKRGKVEPKTVAIPFKSNFSVWDHSDYTNNSCGGFPVFFLTMEGHGTSTHLGQLSTTMTFCCNVITGEYFNAIGNFVAANGDILSFEIPIGYIIPNEGDNSEYYQTWFNDPMIITGGTGRFEGASGNLKTNAFVHDGTDEWRTDFFSTGTLTLPKGR